MTWSTPGHRMRTSDGWTPRVCALAAGPTSRKSRPKRETGVPKGGERQENAHMQMTTTTPNKSQIRRAGSMKKCGKREERKGEAPTELQPLQRAWHHNKTDKVNWELLRNKAKQGRLGGTKKPYQSWKNNARRHGEMRERNKNLRGKRGNCDLCSRGVCNQGSKTPQ